MEIELNHALWGTTYHPKTTAKIWFCEDEGVYLEMECFETNPKCDYQKDDDPVYKDSCMECFINFDPEHARHYLNMEVNARGAILVQVGTGRKERQNVRALNIKMIKPIPFKTDVSWGFKLLLPFSFIHFFYEHIGNVWQANFYKCGDECDKPHYLAWQYIDSPKPNYHLPEYFGSIKKGR